MPRLYCGLVVLSCLLVTILARTAKENLVRKLLSSYDANVDPGNIRLKFSIRVKSAILDRETGIVTAHVWEKHSWNDSRLMWKAEEYDGSLRLPASLLWTPDMTQFNSAAPKTEREEVNVVVRNDGNVVWIPRTTYSVLCKEDDTRFEITCPWRVGSWTYDGLAIALEADGTDLLVIDYVTMANSPLTVSRHTAFIDTFYHPGCDEPYTAVDATIVFKSRRGIDS